MVAAGSGAGVEGGSGVRVADGGAGEFYAEVGSDSGAGSGIRDPPCPFTEIAAKRINVNIGRIRLNETNLLLFFNNRVIFVIVQSICQKKIACPVNQVFIRGALTALTKISV